MVSGTYIYSLNRAEVLRLDNRGTRLKLYGNLKTTESNDVLSKLYH